jgi:branched-chain amino acid transport system permease protein
MRALGYNVWLIQWLSFVFAGFWGAVAGLLYAYYHQFVSPQTLHLTTSAEALLMVIAGGTGTLFGPVVGAALVVILKNVVSAYITRWLILLGAIFVAIVLFMPEGLLPGLAAWIRRIKERLHGGRKTTGASAITKDRVL